MVPFLTLYLLIGLFTLSDESRAISKDLEKQLKEIDKQEARAADARQRGVLGPKGEYTPAHWLDFEKDRRDARGSATCMKIVVLVFWPWFFGK